MKYVVKSNLIVNKTSDGVVYPGTSEVELEDLGFLRRKDGFPIYKIVNGVAVVRSDAEVKSSGLYQRKVISDRVKAYKEKTDNMAMEIIYMEKSGASNEAIEKKKLVYLEEVAKIKEMYPIS